MIQFLQVISWLNTPDYMSASDVRGKCQEKTKPSVQVKKEKNIIAIFSEKIGLDLPLRNESFSSLLIICLV